MAINALLRRNLAEHFHDIALDAFEPFVDGNAGRRMVRDDKDDAVFDAAIPDNFLHLPGDDDHLIILFGQNRNTLRFNHWSTSNPFPVPKIPARCG